MIASLAEIKAYLGIVDSGVAEVSRIVCTDEDAVDTLHEKAFVLYDENGSVGFWIDLGSGEIPASASECVRSVSIDTILAGDLAAVVATKIAAAINADLKFSAVVESSDEVVATSSLAGPREDAEDGVGIDATGFTFSTDTQGTSTNPDDAFLTEQGQIVSDAIESYCRRKFESTQYTQTFYRSEHSSSKTLTLFMFPIISIASIEEDEVAFTGYRIHKPTGILTRETGAFFLPEETVVTYTAGYATVPLLLKNVVYQAVGERYSKKKAGVGLNFGSDVQRISIPGTISIDFDYSLSNNDRTTPFGGIIGNYLNQLDSFRSERALIGTDKLSYNEVTP